MVRSKERHDSRKERFPWAEYSLVVKVFVYSVRRRMLLRLLLRCVGVGLDPEAAPIVAEWRDLVEWVCRWPTSCLPGIVLADVAYRHNRNLPSQHALTFSSLSDSLSSFS